MTSGKNEFGLCVLKLVESKGIVMVWVVLDAVARLWALRGASVFNAPSLLQLQRPRTATIAAVQRDAREMLMVRSSLDVGPDSALRRRNSSASRFVTRVLRVGHIPERRWRGVLPPPPPPPP